jgi:hypothetical protein
MVTLIRGRRGRRRGRAPDVSLAPTLHALSHAQVAMVVVASFTARGVGAP